MAVKVANNAYSTLASGITDSATSISLQTGHGARFPTLGGSDWCYATLIDTSNNLEVVKVTARSSDTLTVTRGQDGTAARAYASGDRIEMRFCKALFDDMIVNLPGNGTLTYAMLDSASIATAAEFRAKTASNLLDTNVWDAAAEVSLTDAATITVDLSTFLNATVTLGGNRTLGQPTNAKVGQSGVIRIVQDGTGSRTLAYHADWEFAGGTAPTLSTTAGANDLLFYYVIASGRVFASLVKKVA